MIFIAAHLVFQSVYLTVNPTVERIQSEVATDITYFDMMDMTKQTFRLCGYLVLLGFLAGTLEWPVLRDFEEERAMANEANARMDIIVASKSSFEVTESKLPI